MPDRPIPEEFLDGYARILADVALTGRRLTRDELDACRQVGERAAEAGFGLRRCVRAYLVETRATWPRLSAGQGVRELRAATDSVIAAVEQAVDAIGEGYERAQRLAIRQEEAARREFIDDLLHGRGDLGRLSARAERFGLRLAHAHIVAVARGRESYDDTHPVTRGVDLALTTRFGERQTLLATKGDHLVCVAPEGHDDVVRFFADRVREAAGEGCRVGVGRPHTGLGGVVRSYEEALNALTLGARLSFGAPVLHADDLLVFPVLMRDRQAMADLIRTTLGPLTAARGGPEPLLKTLDAYFESGYVAAEAARRLALSVRALTYRLERIHRLTGSDPTDPLQRYTLQTAVIGARLLDWPAEPL